MATNENNLPPLHPRDLRSGAAAGATAGLAAGARGGSTSGSSSGVATGSDQSAVEQIPPHGYPSSLKLPTFWITRPELWFIQVESAFRNRHPSVTSDVVKFDCVIGALPNEVLEKVEHVLTSPAQQF